VIVGSGRESGERLEQGFERGFVGQEEGDSVCALCKQLRRALERRG
jgi:hypothetical protein